MALLVKDIVSSFFVQKQEWHAQLLTQWDAIVGSLKTRVRLEKIQDDMLIIGVYESQWMQELYLLSNILIDSINDCLGKRYVKKVRFILVEERRKVLRRVFPVFPKEVMLSVLTDQQKKALAPIVDEQLKEVLIQFWSRCNIGE